MKILLLNGSPNAKGCTYTALCEVAKTIKGTAAMVRSLKLIDVNPLVVPRGLVKS